MSLINDALKKARQSQTGGPVAEGPAFRPAEERPAPDRGGLWLPVLIGAVLAVSGILVWQWYTTGAVTEVRARTASVTVAAAPVPSKPSAPIADPPPVPAVDKVAAAPAIPAPPVKGPENTTSNLTAAATNAALAEPPKPPPPAFKLQGIFYRPGNPMAVINGKSVFTGDRVGDGRVVSIEKDAATVVTATGQTNLLELQ